MIEAVLVMLSIGAVCGTVLSVASKIFYVYEDPRIEKVEGFMAAANCGGCGYAGCSAAAVAVVEGKAGANVCVISDAEAAANVGAVMGLEVGSAEAQISYNECSGGTRATDKFYYDGVNSCLAMDAFYGGKRDCSIGCLGLGDCVDVCLFNAIKIGPQGYPVVDENKCVGCGACARICPKDLFEIKSISERLLDFNQQNGALAPCQQTCPAEINIPKYIAEIRNGDYESAVSTIRARNPFLLSCGRVCPHPCEDYCRRGIEEEPVSINQLKRFAADFEMNSGSRIPIKCSPDTGKKVAVIGGGPAGLSCAFFLRRLGHSVSIYEAMPKLGGMLRYGIPEYRLPKKVLDWEIEGILNLGIEVRTNVRMGEDYNLGNLTTSGFDAVFFGIGAWSDYKLGVEGEHLKGCYTGIDFLSRIGNGEDIPIGKRTAVVGGGNTAIDCVRTIARMGAQEVYIIYRRTRNEMPANMVEIEASEHEGIKFVFLAAPEQVVADENGAVKQLEYLKMELGEPDASGRRRPVPVKGSETRLDIDMLITAIGQQPDAGFKENSKRLEDLKLTRWNTIDAQPETLQSNIPYIFTAGDCATGPALVVDAIGGGRRAARSIHQYLNGQEVIDSLNPLGKKHIPASLFNSVPGLQPSQRAAMPELPLEERMDSFIEVDQVLSEDTALNESERCLTCCRLCYNT